MKLFILLFLCLSACYVQANVKAVFAHFMVSNTATYTIADWENDITLARDAKIDGFVMNMGKDEATNGASLANAFVAANNLGSTFKLLFSFDYAGNGLWDKANVIALINQYKSNPAYYYRGSKPLVSTFEGPKAAADWPSIKAATGCFFMPSWSSLGAKPAWELGAADGLFSWAAWPTGNNPMDTFTDASYLDTLNGAPYMMGVSPWFYTNMPGFRKNWLWRGDSLWFDRWINVMFLQPEYVQIITWNDFGESHYIGPLKDKAFEAFGRGKSPFNYAIGKHHNGWRALLPNLIDLAKSNSTSITKENVVGWYRPHPKSACGTGGTTGNTASQLQQVFAPGELTEDKVFFAAILGSQATITVIIGGVASPAIWTFAPSNGVGLYRGSIDLNGRTGSVVINIARGGTTILSASGDAISTSCTSGMQNYNPYVISTQGRAIAAISPLPLNQIGCTSGFGDKKYRNLCEIACKYDYCPRGACTCTSMGTRLVRPTAKNLFACPAPGIDTTYLGLCAMVCNYATCPDVCKIMPAGTTCSAPLPTAPPVPLCVAGMADGKYAAMCSFSCALGFCPPEICTCTRAGTSVPASPPITNAVGTFKGAEDFGLCSWTCKRGVCPSDLCNCSGSACPGGDSDGGSSPHTFFQVTKSMVVRGIKGELGEGCRLVEGCRDQLNIGDSSCAAGEKKIGYDNHGCPEDTGYSICCPVASVLRPESCKWEAGKLTWWDKGSTNPFCDGQCQPGSVSVLKSIWGNTGTQCLRGTRALCCDAPQFSAAFEGCHWSTCEGSCDSWPGEISLASVGVPCGPSRVNLRLTEAHLCCPPTTPIHDCRWKGTAPSCDDSTCPPDSLTVAHGREGGYVTDVTSTNSKCSNWASTKSLCCRITVPKPPVITLPLTCSSYNMCQDQPAWCEEETAIQNSFDEFDGQGLKRNSHRHLDHHSHVYAALEKRRRPERSQYMQTLLTAQPYWPASTAIDRFQTRGWSIRWVMQGLYCLSLQAQYTSPANNYLIPRGAVLHNDHLLDLQTLPRFIDLTIVGTLRNRNIRSGPFYATNMRLSAALWDGWFVRRSLPVQFPYVAASPRTTNIYVPMWRIFEIMGSNTNPQVMVLLEAMMNMIKGALIDSRVPLSITTFRARVDASIADPNLSIQSWMQYIVGSVGVFDYIHSYGVASTFTDIINAIGLELQLMDQWMYRGDLRLRLRWQEFIQLYLEESATFSQGYVRDLIGYARLRYQANQQIPDAFRILQVLTDAEDAIDTLFWPGYPI